MINNYLKHIVNLFQSKVLSYAHQVMSNWLMKKPFLKQYSQAEINSARIKLNQFITLHYNLRQAKANLRTRENLSEETLDELQKTLSGINNRLSVRPGVPSKARMPIEEDKNALISKFAETYRPIVRNVLNEIQYISWKKFEAALKACIVEFNTQLKLKGIKEYSVILSENTSTSWVFEHAIRYLDILPQKIYATPKLLTTHKCEFPDTTLVIFDDWSISGTQLCTNLNSIDGFEHCNPYEMYKNKHLFLIVPFMTIGAKQKVLDLISRPHCRLKECDVELITRGLVKTVHLTKGFCEKSENRYSQNIISDYEKAFQTSSDNGNSRALVFSDWKTPDMWSNLHCLEKGYINCNASILAPYTGMRYEDVPPSLLQLYNQEIYVLPKTKPPYEKESLESLYGNASYIL